MFTGRPHNDDAYFSTIQFLPSVQNMNYTVYCKKYRAGSHHCFLTMPVLKASPLKCLPHSSDVDVNLTTIYILYMELLDKK